MLLDATAGSDAGIDVVSRYATVAAEQTALEHLADVVIADQIVARLALYASRSAPGK